MILRVRKRFYRDNGKENGNYYTIESLFWYHQRGPRILRITPMFWSVSFGFVEDKGVGQMHPEAALVKRLASANMSFH